MAGDAKIVLDLDTGPFDKKADAAGKKVKQIGAAAPDFSKSIQGLGKMLISAGAIVRMLQSAGEAAAAFQGKSAEANRTSGKGALSRSASAATLGLSGNAGDAMFSGRGVATQDELDTFASQLAEAKSGGANLSGADIAGAVSNFQQLGPSLGGDIIDRLKKGKGSLSGEEVSGRLSGLSDSAMAEMATRRQERDLELRKMEAERLKGAEYRIAEARIAARNAENPGFAAAQAFVADAIPGAKGIVTAGDVALNSGDSGPSTAATMLTGGGAPLAILTILRQIAGNTGGNLNLSAGTEGAR